MGILSGDKVEFILRCIKELEGYAGALGEFGVYQGDTALAMATASPLRPLYLFDTFAGIPEKGTNDRHEIGDFRDTSLEIVQQKLCQYPFTRFHVGNFMHIEKPDVRYAVVHIDADQYEATKAGLAYFYPRMIKGGCILLDDYKWQNCPGVEIAISEFLADKPEEETQSTGYQALIKKL